MIITSSSVLSSDGVSSGITLVGKGSFLCAGGARGARRFFGAPTEFMDPMEVAAESMLILSELSVFILCLGEGWVVNKLPELGDERFDIDIDLVGGVPAITEPVADGSPRPRCALC